jgi:hypothetical protein
MRLSQRLPSDVEQKLGIRPNSQNGPSQNSGRRYQTPPQYGGRKLTSDEEQRLRIRPNSANPPGSAPGAQRRGVSSDVQQQRWRGGPGPSWGGAPGSGSRKLTSDEEQRLGIRPNSANPPGNAPGFQRRGSPSYVEQPRWRGGPGPDWIGPGPGWAGPPPDLDELTAWCEQRGYRRGLYGNEFVRFVRWCIYNS